MTPLNVLSKVTLCISLFSFSLSSIAGQTSLCIEEQLSSDFSQDKRLFIDRKEVNVLPLENTQSQPSSYLSSLGHIASSTLDGLTKIVLKGYGVYTVVALPIVTALETNLRANTPSKALMPMSEMDLLTKENCLTHFYDPQHCDELFGIPEDQYTAIAARYAFLPQLSYIEMETTTKNILQTKRIAKTKKSKHQLKKIASSINTSIPLSDQLLTGGGTGENIYQGILGAYIAPGDVKIFNVGAGNGVVVKSQTNISNNSNTPRGVHVNWMIDMGSTEKPKYYLNNNDDILGYTDDQINDLKLEITKQFCPNGLNESNLGVIVVTHPDSDHYNWIGGILDDCYERERTRDLLEAEIEIPVGSSGPSFKINTKKTISKQTILEGTPWWTKLETNEKTISAYKKSNKVILNHKTDRQGNLLPQDDVIEFKSFEKLNNFKRALLKDYLYWIFSENYSNDNILNDFFGNKDNVKNSIIGYMGNSSNLNLRRIKLEQNFLENQNIQNSFYFINLGWDSVDGYTPGHDDTNRNSLIMRLRPHDDLNAVILMGDATSNTLADMLVSRHKTNGSNSFSFQFHENLLAPQRAGTIKTVLAPHHGSDKDGSNTIISFLHLKNDANIIFSASGKHAHPKCSSTGLAARFSGSSNNHHKLVCYDSEKPIIFETDKNVQTTMELTPSMMKFDR